MKKTTGLMILFDVYFQAKTHKISLRNYSPYVAVATCNSLIWTDIKFSFHCAVEAFSDSLRIRVVTALE